MIYGSTFLQVLSGSNAFMAVAIFSVSLPIAFSSMSFFKPTLKCYRNDQTN